MAKLATYEQQPGERLDYDVWYAHEPDGGADWLVNGDTVDAVTLTVDPVGLTVDSLTFPDRVKLWVSGGAHGVSYKVTLRASTVEGRTKESELTFKIKEI